MPPCPRRAAGRRGTYLLCPRCRPASPGWGGSSARHKREQAVSGGAVTPEPPPRGTARFGPARGAGEGPARTAPGPAATPDRGCGGQGPMPRPRGRVPGAAGARRVPGASLGRLPAFLDCKGLQRRPAPAPPPLASPRSSPAFGLPSSIAARVARRCGGTRGAGARFPGPPPHGAISPPLTPSLLPSFSRKTLQLWPFPGQHACCPRDAAEPEPCARRGRHGNGRMSRMTGRLCTHTHTARAHACCCRAHAGGRMPSPRGSPCAAPGGVSAFRG